MLNDVLREARLAQHLSQRELAQRASISTAQISYVERAERVPSPALMIAITNQLNLASDAWLPAYLAQETRLATLIRLIELFLRDQRYAEAREVLRVGLAKNRRHYNGRYDYRIYHQAGRLNYHQGRYRVALLWFQRMVRHLSHANAFTRGLALYDYGMSLYRVGRLPEAFFRLQQARAAFGTAHRPLRGFATWALAACLFDQYRYREARRYFAQASHDLKDPPHATEVVFGFVLTTWIVTPSAETFQPLVEFEHQHGPLPDGLRSRWLLTMTIAHRLGKRPDAAMTYAEQINADTTRPDEYAESLAERALCALELNKPGDARQWCAAFDLVAAYATDNMRWFMFLLDQVLKNPRLATGELAIHEGYDRRIQRLLELADPSPA